MMMSLHYRSAKHLYSGSCRTYVIENINLLWWQEIISKIFKVITNINLKAYNTYWLINLFKKKLLFS